jgi:hypothetical protein
LFNDLICGTIHLSLFNVECSGFPVKVYVYLLRLPISADFSVGAVMKCRCVRWGGWTPDRAKDLHDDTSGLTGAERGSDWLRRAAPSGKPADCRVIRTGGE